jgi:hypothetical protein
MPTSPHQQNTQHIWNFQVAHLSCAVLWLLLHLGWYAYTCIIIINILLRTCTS